MAAWRTSSVLVNKILLILEISLVALHVYNDMIVTSE